MLRVSVISDLHIGEYGKFRDTRIPFPNKSAINANVCDVFEKLVVSERLTSDYLLVPGDLSQKADTEEFNQAKRVIEGVAKALGVAHNKIIACPGNHDKNWQVLNALSWDGENANHNKMSYQCMLDVVGDDCWGESSHYQNLCDSSCWGLWSFDDAIVLGYNTTWPDGPEAEGHPGFYNPDHHDAIVSAIEGVRATIEAQVPALLLMHHHPMQYSDPNHVVDFSALANSEDLYRLCADAKIDFIVHGHKHMPRLTMLSVDDRRLIPVLCAGSFCKDLETELQGAALNQFHMIEFATIDSASLKWCGLVRSWSHNMMQGWIKSKQQFSNIDYESPFGCYIEEEALLAEIKQIIASAKEQGERVLDWRSVCDEHPKYSYLSTAVVNAVFLRLRELEIDTLVDDDCGKRVILL